MVDELKPQNRPTFRVAHWFRCQGLVSRDNFLAFQKTFVEIVNSLTSKTGDDLWVYVRGLFDFDDYADCVPINAANLSIVFNPVQRFMNAQAIDWNRDISLQKRTQPFVHTIQVAREMIAKQLNVAPELIALQRNGSDPNAVITNGLDFKEGEEVVYWVENHPTLNNVAWYIRQNRFPNIGNPKGVTIPKEDLATANIPNIVKAFTDAVNDNTKIVAFSEVSHLTGTLLPAKEICAGIHKDYPNVHVHVDGAQSWGAMKHDLQDMGCDSYSGGSHKWYVGPKECGILYMKKERVPNFAPKDIGYDGEMEPPPDLTPRPEGEEPETLQNDASRFEMVGQRNDTNLIGLLYTGDLLELIGFENIGVRIHDLTKHLRKRLLTVQHEVSEYFGVGTDVIFAIETPDDQFETQMYHAILVLKFNEPPYPSASIKCRKKSKKPRGSKKAKSTEKADLSVRLYNRIYDNHKICLSTKKENRMRISPHIYNTIDHMDRLAEAIKQELIYILNSESETVEPTA